MDKSELQSYLFSLEKAIESLDKLSIEEINGVYDAIFDIETSFKSLLED